MSWARKAFRPDGDSVAFDSAHRGFFDNNLAVARAPIYTRPPMPTATEQATALVQARGADSGPYEFEFDLVIALDAEDGLIFSFIWNLED